MLKFKSDNGLPVFAWTEGLDIEESALKQLQSVAELPFLVKHVAVMPDVHYGYGTTVGTVFATQGALVPAAVGVDIGCGMTAVNTHIGAETIRDRKELRAALESVIPHGRSNNGDPGDHGAWNADAIPDEVPRTWHSQLESGFGSIASRYPELKRGTGKLRQLGTLGTGNHFCEVSVDDENTIWLVLHTGSRGIGAHIGELFSKLAYRDLEAWTHRTLDNRSLAHIPECSKHFGGYIEASLWAQKYALTNRHIIMMNAMHALYQYLDLTPQYITPDRWIDCHHNYIAQEHHFGKNVWVTRKGAVRARKGDYCIIPGSMGACTYIAKGLGNANSFMSCSHGAGRRMSRDVAASSITVDQHIASTEGVECIKDASVLDESPLAYKDIDTVMEAQKDLVEARIKLKQIICVKGVSE